MSHYIPLFSKIVDSSIWCEPDFVVKVFLTLLAKKERGGIVKASAFMIAQWAKKTESEVLEALKILSSPDTRRLEPQPFEGRRIQKTDEGWLILNAEYYQALMVQANRRQQNAEAQARYREKHKPQPSEPTVVLTIPTSLNTTEFLEEWAKWMSYRRTVKKVKDWNAMFGAQLEMLSAHPVDGAIKILRTARSNGWQGLQYESGKSAAKGNGELSVFELKTIIEAKEGEAMELKNRNSYEGPLGTEWSSPDDRIKYRKLKLEIKNLTDQLSKKGNQ